MAYSEVGIVNLALLHLGALPIAALAENSPNAIKANAVWQYVRDEILSAKDWKFALSRVALSKNATAPLYGYDYAYTIPTDFLRLKKWTNKGSKFYSEWYWNPSIVYHTLAKQVVYDPPVYPPGFPYVIEALPVGTFCLFTDYDNTTDPLYINYLKRETNVTKYTPAFIKVLSFSLAAQLSIPITESPQKFQLMNMAFQAAMFSAAAVNESYDYIDDETESTSWENAGR